MIYDYHFNSKIHNFYKNHGLNLVYSDITFNVEYIIYKTSSILLYRHLSVSRVIFMAEIDLYID